MRKYLQLFLLLLFYDEGLNLQAQSIPNANFDNWINIPYQEPLSWTSSNRQSLQVLGAPNTFSVTGFSGKGIRIETISNVTDTVFGYIMYGGADADPSQGNGGLPYSQKPSNITGYYRYNLPGNDTAVGIVSFKKNGVVLCSNSIKIRGTGSQTVFTSFSYSLAAQNLTVTPDSVVIAFASSNALGNTGIENGSYLELDLLNFTGAGITQTITNGDFEIWSNQSWDKPALWSVAGGAVTQVAGQSGPFAVEMTTLLYPGNFVGQSGITNGLFPQQGGPPFGGTPFTNNSDTLYGYYKFSGSSDSGVVIVNLRKNGAPIGGSIKYLKTQANWTPFKLAFNAMTPPDTIRIEIYSSMPGNAPQTAVGSKLTVDNLSLYSISVGNSEPKKMQSTFALWPNPCHDFFKFKSSSTVRNFIISDVNGQTILRREVIEEADKIISASDLAPGIYFISMEENGQARHLKFIKD